jgi:sphingomyelin phosphodiesterase
VLHLADLHWDPDYVVGSNAVCKELVCCRADSGDLLNQTDAAGYWGDYRSCDLPWYTIEKAVAHMAEKHSVCVNTSSTGIQIEINIFFPFLHNQDAAYIIWTGDLAPHNVWSTNKEENIYVIERLMNLIQQYFPKTPVYATLGNHEAHPSDT